MSEMTQQKEEEVPLSLQQHVDEICLRFERAWRAKQRPALEDYLGDTPEPERSFLKRELLALEMAYRQREGEVPKAGGDCGRLVPMSPQVEPAACEAATRVSPDVLLNPVTLTGYPGGSRKAAEQVPPTAAPPGFPDGAVAPEQAALPGYEMLGVLGRGGMGVVYKARQRALNRFVAIKMILAGAHAGPEELARFRREAATIARLHHPHIVQIYEIGEHNGQPFCALEYVEGGSLARKLGGMPQPARPAAQLLETLARATYAAHQAGIIHRDLKPANVLLTADGTPKITDFGLAKQMDESTWRTHSDVIMGTPSYMAPEQAAGKRRDIGPHTDVYSLGAVLYELLTGRPPFLGATGMETLVQVRLQEPVPPRRLQPTVPRDLETICLKCLEKDRQRRYASALALAEDLHHFLGNEPIQARPVRVWERGLKWAKRRPVAAALAGVSSLAVLILVVAVFAIMQMRIMEARASQQEARRREQSMARAQEHFSAGQAAFRYQNWQDARDAFEKVLLTIGSEPSLDELRDSAESLLEEVKGNLAELAKLTPFGQARDVALFHATLSTGEGLQANLDATRKASLKALGLFGVAVGGQGGPALKSPLSENQKADILASCYELLLILAESEALQDHFKSLSE